MGWFDHWLEDDPNEDIRPFSHWLEDDGMYKGTDRCCVKCAKQEFCDITLEDDDDDCSEWIEIK